MKHVSRSSPGPARLPFSREAEMSVLGAMVVNPSSIDLVAEILRGDEFFFSAHQDIYGAILELHASKRDVDVVLLKEELQKRKKLESCGGAEYLASLIGSVPNAAMAIEYAKVVKDKSILRKLAETCRDVIRSLETDTEDVKDVLDQAQRSILSIDARWRTSGVKKADVLVKKVFEEIEDFRNRRDRTLGLPTGYYDLDDIISGLQQGSFYIVAGRPSMGKTSLAMNMMENLAVKERKPVLMFSMEMASPTVMFQMLCSHARVDSELVRRGKASEEDYQKLVHAAGVLHEAPIFIDDDSDLSITDIRARVRRMKVEFGIEAVFVDYLQLVRIPLESRRRSDSREREVSFISSQLKALAKEVSVPVVVASQLNRKPDSRKDYRPKLSDLRESGSLEQDADVVLLLFRPEVYDKDTDEKGICYVEVAKNRLGPTGEVTLAFLKSFTRFENLSRYE